MEDAGSNSPELVWQITPPISSKVSSPLQNPFSSPKLFIKFLCFGHSIEVEDFFFFDLLSDLLRVLFWDVTLPPLKVSFTTVLFLPVLSLARSETLDDCTYFLDEGRPEGL